MTTVSVSFPEVMVHRQSVEYAGIHRRYHPNSEEDSQNFVAFTIYSNLIRILRSKIELQF